MKATVLENIEDTLRQLEPEISFTPESFDLVAGTMAHESVGFKYRRQIGGGPALGLCQMEPFTFNDCIENFLAYKPALMAKIIQITGLARLNSADLETNDRLAVCMCRVHYLRDKWAIPKTLKGQAEVWKRHYNTHLGKGRVSDYIRNFQTYITMEKV